MSIRSKKGSSNSAAPLLQTPPHQITFLPARTCGALRFLTLSGTVSHELQQWGGCFIRWREPQLAPSQTAMGTKRTITEASEQCAMAQYSSDYGSCSPDEAPDSVFVPETFFGALAGTDNGDDDLEALHKRLKSTNGDLEPREDDTPAPARPTAHLCAVS